MRERALSLRMRLMLPFLALEIVATAALIAAETLLGRGGDGSRLER